MCIENETLRNIYHRYVFYENKKRVAIVAEPEWDVHSTWTSDNNSQLWTPGKAYTYLGGALGGSEHGPTEKVLDTANKGSSIVNIF